MRRIELMPWEQARLHAAPIRTAVFVAEQGVPPALEMDAMDAKSLHAVAFEGDRAVATGRLLPDGHIGRMAVLKEHRGKGLGGAVLARLMEAAKERGDAEVMLAAQVHAVPFYAARGFEAYGEVYREAGIAHRNMRRAP
jgi:predicted GNAT family N-acyltransferase